MHTTTQQNAWQEIVARAWTDAEFKQRLLAAPTTVLQENGLVPPAGSDVVIVEDQPDRIHLVLPAPVASDLAVMELNAGDYDPGF